MLIRSGSPYIRQEIPVCDDIRKKSVILWQVGLDSDRPERLVGISVRGDCKYVRRVERTRGPNSVSDLSLHCKHETPHKSTHTSRTTYDSVLMGLDVRELLAEVGLAGRGG